ncbi:MAG TPA: hypothetical protein PKM63_20490 [Panacibacter sp.]|nr:hypothetical protein [Panacibacter sp.]HNP46687.1 hypothetical protein [Panacibacter sp.]
MTRARPSCNDVFANAMEVLPRLYREKSFDSMYLAIGIWKDACPAAAEIQVCYMLLAMEQGTFTLAQLDSSSFDNLRWYSTDFEFNQRYPTAYLQKQKAGFYHFCSTWAKLLLEDKKLDTNEQLICKVLTGEIKNPEGEIKKNSSQYPELMALLKKQEDIRQKEVRGTYGLMTGAWIPTGNLALLGVHPSVGGQFGIRNQHHEFDLTLQFRFAKSKDTYTVKRNGSYYDRDAYFGGYIGLDYSYYFFSKAKFEAGFAGGLAYDGFDISGSQNDYEYLKPLSIGSFNANGGLRMNVYVNRDLYIGLQGKYHWINYANPGGTNLNGDAITIDLIFGFNVYHPAGHY